MDMSMNEEQIKELVEYLIEAQLATVRIMTSVNENNLQSAVLFSGIVAGRIQYVLERLPGFVGRKLVTAQDIIAQAVDHGLAVIGD